MHDVWHFTANSFICSFHLSSNINSDQTRQAPMKCWSLDSPVISCGKSKQSSRDQKLQRTSSSFPPAQFSFSKLNTICQKWFFNYLKQNWGEFTCFPETVMSNNQNTGMYWWLIHYESSLLSVGSGIWHLCITDVSVLKGRVTVVLFKKLNEVK